MTRKNDVAKQRAKRKAGKPEILVFAEDPHDSTSIKCLVEALNPALSERIQLRIQRNPGSLTRHALSPAVKSWMQTIADVMRDRSLIADVIGVLVHQDADGPDPEAGGEKGLAESLRAYVGDSAHPVVPVQMTESWWLMFPDGVRAVNRVAWRDLKLPTDRDVEVIDDPKGYLRRETRKTNREYSEADSLAIAQSIAAILKDGGAPSNRSASWDRFALLARGL